MADLIQYPSIKHFKETTGNIYKHLVNAGKQEVINFVGTVKLHGTNFSAVYDLETEEIYYQSRNRIITKIDNFFNFQEVVYGDNGIEPILKSGLKYFAKKEAEFSKIIFFGELVGGEIQKGVALQNIEKRFVIFDIALVDKEGKVTYCEFRNLFILGILLKEFGNNKVSVISDYPYWETTVNVFSKSDLLDTQNKLSQITADIEKECPVAKHFGVSGTGEGVVWRSYRLPHVNNGFGIRFKVKGDEHTTSKVRTLNGVEQGKIEALKSLEDVCEAICTEARYKQGMQYLIENDIKDIHRKNTFLNWVVEDTIKEEIDFIISKGLPVQNVKAQLYKNGVKYWQLHYGITIFKKKAA